MTTPTPDLADRDAELVRLLHDRADTVHPRGTTPGQLARRAGRIRHRRRATAAGLGVAASAVVAVLVVNRSTGDDGARVEASVAGGAEPGTTAPPDGPEPLRFTAITTTTAPPASGAVPRLGLDVPGAVVDSASTFDASLDGSPSPVGVTVDFVGPDEDRHLTINAVFPNGALMADDLPQPEPPEQVDLGDGVIGVISRFSPPPDGLEVPGYPTQEVGIRFELDGEDISVMGSGVTDDELIAVARDVQVGDSVLVVGWVPDDLSPIEPRNPIGGGAGGEGSAIVYDLPDGGSVFIKVTSEGGQIFDDDLEHTRAEPSAFQFVRTVRGTDAVVRKAAGMTSVLWREPSGHLVEVYIGAGGADVDPSFVPDESIVDAIVDLDEATFQDLVTAHPPTTGVPQP